MSELPPALVMIGGAFVLPVAAPWLRRALVLGLPLATLALIWSVPDGPVITFHLLDWQLVPLKGDTAGRLFGTVFALMAFVGGLYAVERASRLELAAAFVYAGSAIGVTGAGDLVTVTVLWETMAIGSTLVIWSSGPHAWRASMRYAMVHLFGGVALMAGVAGHIAATGSVEFGVIGLSGVPSWLILIGFLVNAGAPPFSAWLPDAYPQASPSGTVFLSAFTTKTAVFVLFVCFAGTSLLIWVGLYMVIYGIVYGLLENDIRRILSYSIINQVGFMVCGIGIGGAMALDGAVAHAFTHIIYKALLLMAAGSVMAQTGKRKCSELGGVFRRMPLTTACAIVGALSISAFPFTSGFVSKTMVEAAAAHDHMFWAWLLLYVGSAGVFLDIAMKWVWFVFFQRDKGLEASDPAPTMRLAMVIFAALCLGIGLWPGALYAMLPYPVTYVPYTAGHVVHMAELLLFAGVGFVVLFPLMKRTPTITLDTDWFYRWLGPRLFGHAGRVIGRVDGAVRGTVVALVRDGVAAIERAHGSRGVLARDLPMGLTALVVIVVFALVLLLELAVGA